MANQSAAEDALGTCLDAFFQHKRFVADTRQAYTAHIKEYEKFLRGRGILRFADAAVPDAVAFIAYLRKKQRSGGKPLSPTTISRRLASVSSLYQYLVRTGECKRNPLRGSHRPRTPVRQPPQSLTAEEVELLLHAPQGEGFVPTRDRAVLETLYSSGATVSELRALNVDNVDATQGWVMILKSRHQRTIPLGPFALQAIKAYLKVRATVKHKRKLGDEPLFINRSGNRISHRAIRKVFERYREVVGIPTVSPKVLRSSFANHLVNRGASLRMVQEMLGHKFLSTTRQTVAATGAT